MRFPLNPRKNQRIFGPVLVAVGTAVLASCGLFGKKDKPPIYYSAVEVPALEIPAGLDRPTSSTALLIAVPVAPLPPKEMPTVPPRVSSQSAKEIIPIKWSADGVYLYLDDTPASVFRRVGLVIERSGLSMYQAVGDNAYRFEYDHEPQNLDEGFFSKLAFWRDDAPNYSGVYQAVIRPDGQNSRVYILNGDGSDANPDAAEHLLVILGERLG